MALRSSLQPQPHQYIGDFAGRPLDNGMVYFGEPDKDPEFYPINIYSDSDLSIPLAQPVRTKGGFMYNSGKMTEVYASQYAYSVKVVNNYGAMVFYEPRMERISIKDSIEINTKLDATGSITRTQGDKNAEQVSVKDFGAVGDGVTDDTIAIRKALAYSLKVSFPEPPNFYLVTGTLKMRGGHQLYGWSKSGGVPKNPAKPYEVGIHGRMAVNGTPLLELGDGVTGSLRHMSFNDLSFYNDNGAVAKARYTTEVTFYSCTLRSRNWHCLDTQQTYLSAFYNCAMSAIGTVNNNGVTPCFQLLGMDNTNGILFSNCRISGGRDGGVADIGRSYNIKYDTCVFESSRFGIRLAGNPDTSISGNVNNVTLDTCQFEGGEQALDLGAVNTVVGMKINNLYYTRVKTSPTDLAAIKLGRVNGLVADIINFELADNQYAFEFTYNAVAAGAGSQANLDNSKIDRVIYARATQGYEFKTTGFVNADALSRLARNEIDLRNNRTGVMETFVSLPIVSDTATPATRINTTKPLGTKILKVELLDVQGLVDGIVSIGTDVNQAELLSLDLSTISPTQGYLDITNSLKGTDVRATKSLLYKTTAGVAQGSYRLKITYVG